MACTVETDELPVVFLPSLVRAGEAFLSKFAAKEIGGLEKGKP